MEKKDVERILKSKRKQFVIYSEIFLITVFSILLLSHTLWVKLLSIIPIFIYIIVIGRTATLKYLIDDECNPQLYYYAFLGLNKKEPEPDKKQRVAELIGDFEEALELAHKRLSLCKNDKQRLSIILDIARISFDAGDFDLTRKTYDDFQKLKINQRVKSNYEKLFSFYLYYIDGDYENAKKLFDLYFGKYKSKRVKNILKYKLYYYDGLLALRLGEVEKAQTNLNKVISSCPNLHIAKLSSNLLSNTEII